PAVPARARHISLARGSLPTQRVKTRPSYGCCTRPDTRNATVQHGTPRPPRTKRRGSRTAAPIGPKLGAQPAPPSYPSALAAGRRLAPRPAPAARCSRGGGAPARVELLNRTRSHGRVG